MNKTSYDYYNSQKLYKLEELAFLSEITGMTHLYFDRSFIANQKFYKCFYCDKCIFKQRYKTSIKKEGMKTIFLEKDKLKNNKSFLCKT